MFGSNKGNKSNKGKKNADIDSLVGGNTTIRGDVHFTGGLHVDGAIEGDVVAESEHSMLTTSERGRVTGNVTVHNIVLNGEVVGDVHALEHIELAPKARVTGNVYYKVIEMAMGAEVNGNLIHVKNPQETPQPQPATVSPALSDEDEPLEDELKVAAK